MWCSSPATTGQRGRSTSTAVATGCRTPLAATITTGGGATRQRPTAPPRSRLTCPGLTSSRSSGTSSSRARSGRRTTCGPRSAEIRSGSVPARRLAGRQRGLRRAITGDRRPCTRNAQPSRPPRGRYNYVMQGDGLALEHERPAAVGDAEPADGRAARSHRTRRAIIDAMRALHAEGDLRPTAPRIAARAGVSLRTVWQQFTDMEALLVEAVQRDRDILRSLVSPIDPELPLPARVDMFVNQRATVLEEMTPTWRAARVHQPFSDQLQRERTRRNAGARAEVEQVFAAELGM